MVEPGKAADSHLIDLVISEDKKNGCRRGSQLCPRPT